MQITNLVQSSAGTQTPVVTTTAGSSNTVPTSRTPAPTADTLSITSSNIAIAQTVVTQQVDIALEIKSPVSVSSNQKREDHTGELVDKILKKISHEKESNKDDISDKDKHAAAVKSVSVKIAQSFESASIVLSQIGALDDSVVEDIGQTRNSIDNALNQAANQPSAAVEPVSANTETTAINTVSGSREVSSSLQITTKDGDVVTLNISRSQSAEAGSVESAGGSLAYASFSSSSRIEFSIEGDLDKKEMKAIEQVVKRVNKLAEKLFEGDTGEAMDKLGALKIDTKQLASMSLSMSSSISYQAMSAYSQVSRLPDESAPAIQEPVAQAPVAQPPVQVETVTPASVKATEPVVPTAVQVVNEVVDVVNETVAEDVFDNPFDQIRSLFAQIADSFTFSQSNISSDRKDFVSALFNDITDELEEDHHQHGDDSDDDIAETMMAA